MKFQFAYQKLMKHRKLEEEIAQRDFFEAQRVADLAFEKLESMNEELKRAFQERERVARLGGAVGGELTSYGEFIRGHKVRIEKQAKVVTQTAAIAEQKRLVLVEAVQAFKVLEKLREKRLAAFKKERRQHETKQIDEMVTMRYQQGRGV